MPTIYKSQRGVPITGFLKDAHDLRLLTIKTVKKFPTSYRYVITNNILDLASTIYTNAMMFDAINIDNRSSKEDLLLKHEYISTSKAACMALIGEITFAFELINDGNNFFNGKNDYSKKFHLWVESANTCLKSLTSTLDRIKEKIKQQKDKVSKKYNNKKESKNPST